MASNSQNMPSIGAYKRARWPVANVTQFITILCTEVLRGHIMAGLPFPRSKWNDIMSQMLRACPGYNYSVEQLKRKFARLKAKWKRYNMLLKSNAGFGWDDANDMVVGSNDCWTRQLAAKPKDIRLMRRGCPHYQKLTTIFAPHDEGIVETAQLKLTTIFAPHDEGIVETAQLFTSSCAERAPDSSDESCDSGSSEASINSAQFSALESYRRAKEMLALQAEAKIDLFEKCVKKMKETVPDLSPDTFANACEKFENNPVRCRIFLAMAPNLTRTRAYIEGL